MMPAKPEDIHFDLTDEQLAELKEEFRRANEDQSSGRVYVGRIFDSDLPPDTPKRPLKVEKKKVKAYFTVPEFSAATSVTVTERKLMAPARSHINKYTGEPWVFDEPEMRAFHAPDAEYDAELARSLDSMDHVDSDIIRDLIMAANTQQVAEETDARLREGLRREFSLGRLSGMPLISDGFEFPAFPKITFPDEVNLVEEAPSPKKNAARVIYPSDPAIFKSRPELHPMNRDCDIIPYPQGLLDACNKADGSLFEFKTFTPKLLTEAMARISSWGLNDPTLVLPSFLVDGLDMMRPEEKPKKRPYGSVWEELGQKLIDRQPLTATPVDQPVLEGKRGWYSHQVEGITLVSPRAIVRGIRTDYPLHDFDGPPDSYDPIAARKKAFWEEEVSREDFSGYFDPIGKRELVLNGKLPLLPSLKDFDMSRFKPVTVPEIGGGERYCSTCREPTRHAASLLAVGRDASGRPAKFLTEHYICERCGHHEAQDGKPRCARSSATSCVAHQG